MSRPASTLRQLKLLVAILIFSNIALGCFGFYFLRATDRKYSELIIQAVPTLNDMQTLTATSMEAMRSINPTLFNEPAKYSELAQRARNSLQHDRSLRQTILKRPWLASAPAERRHFQEAGDHFTNSAAGLIPLLESGKISEANQQRETTVRPLFNRYIAATTMAADLLQAESLRASDTLTARTGSLSDIMLGLASWPILAVCAVLAAVVVIVLLIRIFLFNSQEAT